MDDSILSPLERFENHSLYPRAVGVVTKVFYEQGPERALMRAHQIANYMIDAKLLARLRERTKESEPRDDGR